MQRIDTPNRALALFGAGKDGFKDGNLSLGTNPTEFDAAWCNAVQEEIGGVIEATGVALDPTSRTQLYTAIQKLIEMRVGDYALDTGTANAKVVALNPVLAAYTTNFDGSFKNAVANTGACTINFGPSAVPLVRDDGAALQGGDLAAGMIIFYDYVQADGKAYITSMVQSQGDGRYMLQNNPTLGLVETFGDPAGARDRRYYDVTNITGLQYLGANINAEYMTVNNTAYTGGAWAGRDVAGACYAEVMTDAGQKLYYYAATAGAGVAPAWVFLGGIDLSGPGPFTAPTKLPSFTASVNANALTGTLAPIVMDFRNAALGTGTPVTQPISASLSLTVPSGATLGTVNATAARLVWLVAYNGGSPVLCVTNLAGGLNLDETTLISPTTIGGASNSNNIIYSASAVAANSPFRVIGFTDITEAAAGTWATAPSTVQPAGGQALAALSSMGYGQTRQAVTRTAGTTYYNTTGRSIKFIPNLISTGAGIYTYTVTIGGMAYPVNIYGVSGSYTDMREWTVLPGESYSVATTANCTVSSCAEIR